jgi:hypothetical protein
MYFIVILSGSAADSAGARQITWSRPKPGPFTFLRSQLHRITTGMAGLGLGSKGVWYCRLSLLSDRKEEIHVLYCESYLKLELP